MEQKRLIEENGMKIAIQKILLQINTKIQKYKETKKESLKMEIAELLKDRDLVYSYNKDTIKKYLNR